MKGSTFQSPKIWSKHQELHEVRYGPQGMTVLTSLINLNDVYTCACLRYLV
jgi:hypothetical protein